jgi:hypothetical protein
MKSIFTCQSAPSSLESSVYKVQKPVFGETPVKALLDRPELACYSKILRLKSVLIVSNSQYVTPFDAD